MFHLWRYEENLPIRGQTAKLPVLPTSGFSPVQQVADRVIMDHLLHALPRRLRGPDGMKGPTTLGELVDAVELAEATWVKDDREREPPLSQRGNTPWRLPEGASRPGGRPPIPLPADEPMPTEPAARAWWAGCILHCETPPGAPMTTVTLGGERVQAVVDSGSAVTQGVTPRTLPQGLHPDHLRTRRHPELAGQEGYP